MLKFRQFALGTTVLLSVVTTPAYVNAASIPLGNCMLGPGDTCTTDAIDVTLDAAATVNGTYLAAGTVVAKTVYQVIAAPETSPGSGIFETVTMRSQVWGVHPALSFGTVFWSFESNPIYFTDFVLGSQGEVSGYIDPDAGMMGQERTADNNIGINFSGLDIIGLTTNYSNPGLSADQRTKIIEFDTYSAPTGTSSTLLTDLYGLYTASSVAGEFGPGEQLIIDLIVPASAPEPSTLALLGMGLLALGAFRRRMRNTRTPGLRDLARTS